MPQANRGRPSHKPTTEQRRIVETLSGYAIPQDDIALVINIDRKTLTKHYADEIRRGGALVHAKLVGNLLRLSSSENQAVALKATMFSLQSRFGWSAFLPRPESEPRLGKKEQLERDADNPPENWAHLVN